MAKKLKVLGAFGATDEQVSAAVNAYLDENPVEAGVTEEELNQAVEDALTEAKESGAFKGDPGKDGADGQPGKDGADGQPGKDGADGQPGKDGADGKDYVLTEADKQEIAGMVNVSGGSVGLDTTLKVSGKAADAKATGDAIAAEKQSREEAVNQLSQQIDDKVGTSELNTAVENALTEAKNSGEFKGDKGDPGENGKDGAPGEPGQDGADGYTPIKGTDYWTPTDKTEIVNEVLAALPTWTGGAY